MRKFYIVLVLIIVSIQMINAQVLTEGFENWPPENWTLDPATGTGSWTQSDCDVPTRGGNAGPGTAFEGDFAAMFNNYDYIPNVTGSMTTPAFDISGLANPMVHFYWWNNDAPLEPALVVIQSSVNGMDFINLDTIEAKGSGPEWVEYYHLLEGDETYIKIIGVSDYGLKNTFIDDFTIEEAPGCIQPTHLTASNHQPNSVDIDWNNGLDEEAWIIEFGTEGFELGFGTQIFVDEHPYTLSELLSNTKYDVYVQSDCGDETSPWSTVLTFSTTCEAVNSLPWEEGFEEGDLGCFQVQQSNEEESWYWTNDATLLGPQAGEGYARIAYSLSPQDEWLISPVFDFTDQNPTQISFWWALNYNLSVITDSYDLLVKTSTDGNSWSTVWDETMAGEFESWVYYQTIIDISEFAGEEHFQFAFNYVGTDGAAAYLDEVLVDLETGINNVSNQNVISILPNPAKDFVNINSIETIDNIEIYNLSGQLIQTMGSLQTHYFKLDVSNLKKGQYIFKFSSEQSVHSEKLTIF